MILPKVLSILFTITYTYASPIAKRGCKSSCGGVDIPYPFGIGSDCFLEGFEVECTNTTTGENPSLHGYPLHSIDISAAQARINNSFTWECKANGINKASTFSQLPGVINLSSTPFRFSYTLSKLIVVGCQMLGKVNMTQDNHTPHQAGCISYCDSENRISDHEYQPCGGIGCCQTDIPSNMRFSQVSFDPKYTYFPDYNPCRYIALMEATAFNYTKDYVTKEGILKEHIVPLVLDWTIGNKCTDPGNQWYVCKSTNSTCSNSRIGGYTCHCATGYEGNPYISGGCTDIDECKPMNNMCQAINMKCQNTMGSYECFCPWGMRFNGKGCNSFGLAVMFMIGAGACLVLLLIVFSAYIFIKMYKKRQIKGTRQRNLKRHEDILLLKHGDRTGRMTTFTMEELEKATNNFDETLVVGTGGHGKVFKGILSDKRVVAIKKPIKNTNREIDEFLNEAVILSQLNHRNIVKFFGCCLESEAPLLVYEFISNKTLTDHLHVGEGQSLPWNDRLRIALETAGTLAYLHSAASISVFHRDIKTNNILLNEGLVTKLSDFGASRLVPVDVRTAPNTKPQGTFGYFDPEYIRTGRLTAKSDVYSFGVILAELLTRMKPICNLPDDESVDGDKNSLLTTSLVEYFCSAMREDRLHEIFDQQVVDEENNAELKSIAELAEKCMRSTGVERPTMKEVETTLELLWSSKHRSMYRLKTNERSEQQRNLLNGEHIQGDASRVYSFEVELMRSADLSR